MTKEEAIILLDILHDEIARYTHSAPRELWNIYYKLEKIISNGT